MGLWEDLYAFKCVVFTSIRQARWRCPSEPIRVVVVKGTEREGHGAPRGHITEQPLITSRHIDENSVRATDVLFACYCVNLGLPGLLSSKR